ncbi:MAG: hypothetical protein HQL03_10860 [Nitrospirae bacterium]|nr:hypothetical protein [Nitrospirota bacterium]MBF0593112.1 hypothetical protein [Nitrospirota bacterium]
MSIKDLFQPKWKHCDPAVRKAAVEKLTDQKVLADIAKHDKDWSVRAAAHEKLGNKEEALFEVAKNAMPSKVRKAAVEKLTDQKVLADVAKNDEDWNIPNAAVAKLTDRTMLEDVAKNARYSRVRKAAYYKLGCQWGVLLEQAKGERSNGGKYCWKERKAAAMELIAIAKNNPHALLNDWNRIKNIVTTAHTDKHTGCAIAPHGDSGIGLDFPPYPSHLEQK